MSPSSRLFSLFLLPLVLTQLATPRDLLKLRRPAQAPREWQRYTAFGEDFSVSLPFTPAMNTNAISYARNKYRRERTLGAYADRVVFLIETFQKKGISFDEVEKRNGSCAIAESIRVDGVAGKVCNSELRTGKFFETDANPYQFVAVADKMEDHSAALAKFFSSISFRANPESVTVFDGTGDQPLSHVNGANADSIFLSRDMTVRARVVSKPEPQFTEAARQNQVTGTVVLRAIFSMSGAVEDVTVVRGLPDGLTEKAIMAARQIRFIPAIKDGRFVSMKM